MTLKSGRLFWPLSQSYKCIYAFLALRFKIHVSRISYNLLTRYTRLQARNLTFSWNMCAYIFRCMYMFGSQQHNKVNYSWFKSCANLLWPKLWDPFIVERIQRTWFTWSTGYSSRYRFKEENHLFLKQIHVCILYVSLLECRVTKTQ